MKKKLIVIMLASSLMVGCTFNQSSKRNSESKSSSSEDTSEMSSSESSSSSEDSLSSGSSEGSSSDSSGSSSSDSSLPDDDPNPTKYDYDGYYKDLAWSDGEDLINKLHTIISNGYTSLKYEGNWATNQNADQALDDQEMVDLVYSKNKDLKTNTYANGKGWQREHAFAASLMTGFTTTDAVGTGNGRTTDFHNLFASDNSGNGSRGNKNFGVANPDAEDGSYLEGGDYRSDSKNFEPSNTDKGRLSRAIFYMAVMYNQEESQTVKTTLNYNSADTATYGKKSTTITLPVTYQPLKVVEEYVPYSKFTYTNWYYYETKPESMEDEVYEKLVAAVNKYGHTEEGYARYSEENCQFAIGNLSTLLSWADLYTVDYGEMQHNTYVYKDSGQGNRNPFVDYPDLVSYAFGEKKNEAGSLLDVRPTYTSLRMDKDEINHYSIKTAKREYDSGSTFTKDDYTIVGINNNFSEVPATYTDETEDYEFTEQDAVNGKATVTIKTPLNDIKLGVVVNSGSMESCSYQGHLLNKVKGDFTNGGTTNIEGVDWKFSWTNSNATCGGKENTFGMKFGAASPKGVNELTIETTSSKTINMLYLKGSCASNQTINYILKVGNDVVASGSITRVTGATGPEVVGDSFPELTGKITIIINGSGAANGAVYIHTLAFNEVN